MVEGEEEEEEQEAAAAAARGAAAGGAGDDARLGLGEQEALGLLDAALL